MVAVGGCNGDGSRPADGVVGHGASRKGLWDFPWLAIGEGAIIGNIEVITASPPALAIRERIDVHRLTNGEWGCRDYGDITGYALSDADMAKVASKSERAIHCGTYRNTGSRVINCSAPDC